MYKSGSQRYSFNTRNTNVCGVMGEGLRVKGMAPTKDFKDSKDLIIRRSLIRRSKNILKKSPKSFVINKMFVYLQ